MYKINRIEFETEKEVAEYLLTATTVNANGCTSLKKLSAPMATRVHANGCTSLIELSAPMAAKVNVDGCISLIELSAPMATAVYADGCTSLASCNGYKQLSKEECEANLKKVAAQALATKDALQMSKVHVCDTTHCIAGWAIFNHPDGQDMQRRCGWWAAGKFLLGNNAASHFYDNQADGLKYLKSV